MAKRSLKINFKTSHPFAAFCYLFGFPVNVSTNIADEISYGYGELDSNGFWQYPLYGTRKRKCLFKLNMLLPPYYITQDQAEYFFRWERDMDGIHKYPHNNMNFEQWLKRYGFKLI